MAAAAIIDRTFIDVCAKSKRKILVIKLTRKPRPPPTLQLQAKLTMENGKRLRGEESDMTVLRCI